MTDTAQSVTHHLIHAGEIVDSLARATVKATPNAREVLPHIDAAKSFTTAADALYEAAERIASGEPVNGAGLALALRVAAVKAAEGRALVNFPLS